MTTAVPFNHPAWIEIDLKQFKKNLQVIKNYIGPKVKLCLPVKANAYGHGLVDISKAAEQENVDYFGVSCLQEGILLREAGIKTPILVLGAIHHDQIQNFIRYDLEFTIASLFKAKMVVEECAKLKHTVKVHLEVDTGFHRTGVRVETAPAVLQFIRNNPCFVLKGVYSHLATADEVDNPFTKTQIESFLEFLQQENLLGNPEIICHLANSPAMVFFPETHLDMVRPGILSFGYYPRHDMPQQLLEIKPCLSVKAKVSYFKTILPGSGVSYNHRFVTDKQTRIITVPLGYGDGLRRGLSNKGKVLLNGNTYPIVGNICMDQFMVDIGDDSAYVGDVVTIVSADPRQKASIAEHSRLCETIDYEILCGFNNRLPRVYL